jgi:hypothetical protein
MRIPRFRLIRGDTKLPFNTVRRAVADLVASQGCGCCENRDLKQSALNRLESWLGKDFYRYTSEAYAEQERLG